MTDMQKTNKNKKKTFVTYFEIKTFNVFRLIFIDYFLEFDNTSVF